MIRRITVTDRIDVDRRDPRFCGTCKWLEAFADSCARFPTRNGFMRRLKLGRVVKGEMAIGPTEWGYLRCSQCRKAESK